MRRSKLFTNTELKILEARLKGDKSDRTGTFSARIRPKILELLWWMKRQDELNNLMHPKDHPKRTEARPL